MTNASTPTAQAVSAAISEAISEAIRPVLSRQLGEVPEIAWRLITDDASAWTLDGLGPVRVSAQIASHDYGEIRQLIDEIARLFGGGRVREVSPFPGRPITNVETTVSIEGVPVTVWGTTAVPSAD